MAALVLEAASEPASLDEIVAQVAETARITRPGEELAGKVRAQLRELYGADFFGVRCRSRCLLHPIVSPRAARTVSPIASRSFAKPISRQ
jgi:hypothetical protein